MQFKKFRSTIGDIIVASVSGHSAIIGESFISLPETLWSDAYSQGAIPEDIIIGSTEEYVKKVKEESDLRSLSDRSVHKAKFKEALENPNDYVYNNGRLNYRNFIALVGEPLKNIYIDSLWDEVTSEELVDKKGRPLNTTKE
jgi:hypothetical protein